MESKNSRVEFKIYEININKVDDYLQRSEIDLKYESWKPKINSN